MLEGYKLFCFTFRNIKTGRININYCPMCGRDLKEGIFWSF